jgi:hypothetical protein
MFMPMTPQVLIQSIMQQTTVLIAQLATSGGVRAPLGSLAKHVFLDLSNELQSQGVRKNVIADMFGLSLRTFHRKMVELGESRTVAGRTVWEAVLDYVRHHEPVSAINVQERFARDDGEIVSGVLNDLSDSGFVFRAGRGSEAIYRYADAADYGALEARPAAEQYIVWQVIYRNGPLSRARLIQITRLSEAGCDAALSPLVADGRVQYQEATQVYTSARIDVPVDHSCGWEAAVLDHFQTMVAAICSKLTNGEARAREREYTGGGTISLDICVGHPFELEALGTLSRLRTELEDLRCRVDESNRITGKVGSDRLSVYFGQHLKREE